MRRLVLTLAVMLAATAPAWALNPLGLPTIGIEQTGSCRAFTVKDLSTAAPFADVPIGCVNTGTGTFSFLSSGASVGAIIRNWPGTPANGFFASGSGAQLSDCNSFENCATKSTDTAYVQALIRNKTQQGTNIAENTLSLDTYSNTGYAASPGIGDKVGISNLMQVGPNGGHTWGIATNTIVLPGAQSQFVVGDEHDFGDLSKPCLTRMQCHNLWLYGNTVYPTTGQLTLATPQQTPAVGVPGAWTASTAYAISNLGAPIVKNGANYYYLTQAGTSAASGGPTGTTPNVDIADGSAKWRFYDPEFQNTGHDISPYLGGATIYGAFFQGNNTVREAAIADSTAGRYGWYSDDGAKHVATIYDRSHSTTGIDLSGTYADSAFKTTNFKIKGAGGGVENLYTTLPANYFGASGISPSFSFCVREAGCGTDANGNPIDGQRAQLFLSGTTQEDGDRQEFLMFGVLHNNKGKAILWRTNQVYGPGTANGVVTAAAGGGYQLSASITGTCTTSSTNTGGPSAKTTGIADGTCSWDYVSDAGGSKTNLGLTQIMSGDAGAGWVGAFHLVRNNLTDNTAFATVLELDNSTNDSIDHAPGTPYGDVYGIFQNIGGGGGTTTAAHLISGPQPPASPGVTVTFTAGSDRATVSSTYGVYPNTLIQGAGSYLQDETYVGSVDTDHNIISLVGRDLVTSRGATTSGAVTAQFQQYATHIGGLILGEYTAKDAGYVVSSRSDWAFVNNAPKNIQGGFRDTNGTRPFGYVADATYSISAFDTTSANTNFALRTKLGQHICLDGAIKCASGDSTTNSIAFDTTITAPAYRVGATSGVSCTGAPTSSYQVINGIVTHC